jgi:hypothetical protein
MTTLITSLAVRREEFDNHYGLARALEDRMMLEADSSLGGVSLSARHINTVKSGLVIHLYNIEEALMTESLQMLGNALGEAEPRQWTEHSLREWLREAVVSRISEGGEDGRLDTVVASSTQLLTIAALGPQKLKKPSGTWDDKAIATFMRRVSMDIDMPGEMWRRLTPQPHYADATPLQFLAGRRNAIAHGRRSFEEGANDLQLSDIRVLADIVLDYLDYVARAFHAHIDTRAHLVAAA